MKQRQRMNKSCANGDELLRLVRIVEGARQDVMAGWPKCAYCLKYNYTCNYTSRVPKSQYIAKDEYVMRLQERVRSLKEALAFTKAQTTMIPLVVFIRYPRMEKVQFKQIKVRYVRQHRWKRG